ncbi:MAG: BatA and WFA domain-containing protein, partial [Myxococcota bacterium]
MLSFLSPLGFWAALSVPALVAIYWFRVRKQKRRIVSSLMLWSSTQMSKDGGMRLERLRTPWWFFLDLLILLLLIIAAAHPTGQFAERESVMLVLDNSFSMRAGQTESSKQRAIRAIERRLGLMGMTRAWFVLADKQPQLLGQFTRRQWKQVWQRWTCLAPNGSLEKAIQFAFQLAGKKGKIIVVTDHPPPPKTTLHHLRWWSFGRPLANLAWIQAKRERVGGKDHVLLEVANFSKRPQRTSILLRSGKQPPVRKSLNLRPNGVSRVQMVVPPTVFSAQLPSDVLNIDNRVVLLPTRRRHLRVHLRVRKPFWRKSLPRVLRASQRVHFVTLERDPDLIFTDQALETDATPRGWTIYLRSDVKPLTYTGPFLLQRPHPLTEGLSSEGLLWSTGKRTESPGEPVFFAGSTPLLRNIEDPEGRMQLYLHINPEISNLTQHLSWPILIWNLIAWRQQHLPGLAQYRINVRLGETVLYTRTQKQVPIELLHP